MVNVVLDRLYWTPSEAAREFRVTVRTIYKWLREHALEEVEPIGRRPGRRPRRRITSASVEALRHHLLGGSPAL